MNKKLVSGLSASAIAVIATVALLAGVTQPGIHLAPGDNVTVDCGTDLTIAPQSANSVRIDCSGPSPTSSPTASPTPSPTASPTPTPSPTPSPTPTPTPTPSVTLPPTNAFYGSCINADTKSNLQVGWTNKAKVAHRFRATQTSTITSIRFQQRGGTGYSGGTGGTMRISVQTDVAGKPSGTIIGTPGTYGPKVPAGGIFDLVTMNAPVTAGTLYDVVFENTDPNQQANYISVNELFVFGGILTPRQPAFPDSDYAVLYADPTWHLEPQFTADMDLTYANGKHDGMAYVQNMIDKYGTISGVKSVREHFTVTGSPVTLSSVSVRVRRASGSDALTLSVKQGATTIATGSVPASQIPVSAAGGDNGGSVWATAALPATTLAVGQTYDLVLTAPSSSAYTAAPIREGTDSGLLSYAFRDGSGQFTTNGSSWADLYAFSPVDIQFCFR